MKKAEKMFWKGIFIANVIWVVMLILSKVLR